MMKKPDLVVWSEENGYDASKKSYPTNVTAPKFDLPNVGLVKKESSKKMLDVFDEVFCHDGYGNFSVSVRILKRGQKEVIIDCGKN